MRLHGICDDCGLGEKEDNTKNFRVSLAKRLGKLERRALGQYTVSIYAINEDDAVIGKRSVMLVRALPMQQF